MILTSQVSGLIAALLGKAPVGSGSNAWSAASAIAPVITNNLGVTVTETFYSAQYWISEGKVMTLAVDVAYTFSADPPTLTADFSGIDITLPESKAFADAIADVLQLGFVKQTSLLSGTGGGTAQRKDANTLRASAGTVEVSDGDSIRMSAHASFLLDW